MRGFAIIAHVFAPHIWKLATTMQKYRCANCNEIFDETKIRDIHWEIHENAIGCPHCLSILTVPNEKIYPKKLIYSTIFSSAIALTIYGLVRVLNANDEWLLLTFPFLAWTLFKGVDMRITDWKILNKIHETELVEVAANKPL